MVQFSHPYITTGKTIQTFVGQSLVLSWFSMINVWMSPSRHKYTRGRMNTGMNTFRSQVTGPPFNPQLSTDWHKWPQNRSLIVSAVFPSLWHEVVGLHEKISLGILPAPTLEPKDFNKEWKAFLPFGEISVKTGRKVKTLLKSHPRGPSPSDHTFLPGAKGPDSTSAADFEDISETLSTLDVVIMGFPGGLGIKNLPAMHPGSIPG